MEQELNNVKFSVQVYGNLTPYNDVISKARVRIFYKGLNRNRTYITDEFAEKLLSTISYSPICGIYDEEQEDFLDHGTSRETAKAYGVVPENPNIAWENHLDPDGVERTYACADVLLWTARYKAASKIPGSAHSMELYQSSIKGQWEVIDGVKCYKFTDACFIGLTPLGKDVEPCFEGSAFYTLTNSLTELVNELRNYNLITDELEGGETQMVNFKMSDSKKHQLIWEHINPNYTAEGDWVIDHGIVEVYDDYALIVNYEDQTYSRLPYSKQEDDTIIFGEKIQVFVIDVTASEMASLNAIKVLNNETYENCEAIVNDKDVEIENLTNDIQTKEETINTLTQEKDELISSNEELNNTVASLNETVNTLTEEKEELVNTVTNLQEYKYTQETNEKKQIIAKYQSKLDETVIQQFSQNMDNFSIIDLNKELALKLVENDPSIFSKDGVPYVSTETEDSALSPAARLLKRYRNKNSENGGNE